MATLTLNDDHTGTTYDAASPSQAYRILVLPGGHVGPEVISETLRVLDVIQTASKGAVNFEHNHQLVGGSSIDEHGVPITDEVLHMAREESDAVLFGSLGGAKW